MDKEERAKLHAEAFYLVLSAFYETVVKTKQDSIVASINKKEVQDNINKYLMEKGDILNDQIMFAPTAKPNTIMVLPLYHYFTDPRTGCYSNCIWGSAFDNVEFIRQLIKYESVPWVKDELSIIGAYGYYVGEKGLIILDFNDTDCKQIQFDTQGVNSDHIMFSKGY